MVKGKESKKGSDQVLEKLTLLTEKNVEASRQLIERIDKMFTLFEEASKHVTEVESTEAKVNALTQRLSELLEQNRSIAQGLILLEKYVRGRSRLEEGVPGARPVSEYSA